MIKQANCKINIGLDILEKRPDGYHNIETVMIPVRGMYDTLEFERIESGFEFSSSGIVVDCPPENNLCVKAFHILEERYAIRDVKLHLHKITPFGAGLGGGAADASTAIMGINELLNLGLTKAEMISLAAELGSDMPFFIENKPTLCSGRGEVMQPIDIPALNGLWLAVVKPQFGISTAEAYGGVIPAIPQISLSERLSADISAWRDTIRNGVEPHLFGIYPQLAQIKEELYQAGAIYVSMSGSGSAMYGVFAQQPQLQFTSEMEAIHLDKMAF